MQEVTFDRTAPATETPAMRSGAGCIMNLVRRLLPSLFARNERVLVLWSEEKLERVVVRVPR